jgi:hypothetical protein
MKISTFWDITPCNPLTLTEVSEEYVALLSTCLHVGFLLSLFFDPEDGGDMFLRKVSLLATDNMVLYPTK